MFVVITHRPAGHRTSPKSRAMPKCPLAKANEQAYQCIRKRTSERMTSMAIYGYARVSTSRQAEEGESLDVQQRTVAGYALMIGLTVDRMFIERGVSGSVPLADRPQGAA